MKERHVKTHTKADYGDKNKTKKKNCYDMIMWTLLLKSAKFFMKQLINRLANHLC